MLSIEEVLDRKQRDAFVALLGAINQGDPHFVQPLLVSERAAIDVDQHPYYREVEAKFYLAREDGEVVGRVASIYHRKDQKGYFGFLQAFPRPEVFSRLLAQVEQDLEAYGVTSILGPVNPGINYEMGILTDGFDAPPYLMLSHNPDYYDAMVRAAGYAPAKDFFSYFTRKGELQNVDKIERVRQRIEARLPVRVRNPNMRRFRKEIEIVERIYNDSMADHWGFVPISSEEFAYMAADMKRIIDPKMVFIAEVEGRAAGFIMALPNVNEVFRRVGHGRLNPMSIFKLLYYKSRVRGLRVITLGVAQEFQHYGLGSLLYSHLIENFLESQYEEVEFSWVMEDNVPVKKISTALGARPYKTYRLYQKG